jgi:hypothetical protein
MPLITPLSHTLNPCPSLSVRDNVSQPYKTTGNIIVLYILVLTFLDASPIKLTGKLCGARISYCEFAHFK